MIRALLVEDQAYIRKGLLNLLQLLDINLSVIGECESVKEAITVANACKPDLIFLDIHLTDGNAFQFLNKTEHLQFKVIFITAYEEYALQAFKIGAIDYLLKPIDIEELEKAIHKVTQLSINTQRLQLNKVKQSWSITENKLILSLQDSFQVIDLQELIYCKSDKGYTTFYLTKNRKHIASKPLKEFEKQLTNANFIRTHQSFIVNLNFIDKYDKSGIIILKNKQKIPVSFRKKEYFLSTFLNLKKKE